MTIAHEVTPTGYTGDSPVSKELPKINELPTRPQQMAEIAIELINDLLDSPRIHDRETDPEAYIERYKSTQAYNESRAWLDENSDKLESQIADDLAELYNSDREEIEKWNRGADRAWLFNIPKGRVVYRDINDFATGGVEAKTAKSGTESVSDFCIRSIAALIVRQQYLSDLGQIVDKNQDGTDNAEEVNAAREILGEDPFRTVFNQNILAKVMHAGRDFRPEHADEPPANSHQSHHQSPQLEQPATADVRPAA